MKVKKFAWNLKKELEKEKVKLPISKVLEIVSRAQGHRNWGVAQATSPELVLEQDTDSQEPVVKETKEPQKYYWGETGKYQKELEVIKSLVPDEGPCDTLEGEFIRAAQRIYYDFYNNGFGNRWVGALALLNRYLEKIGVRSKDILLLKPYANGDRRVGAAKEIKVGKALESILDAVILHITSKNKEYAKTDLDILELPSSFLDDLENNNKKVPKKIEVTCSQCDKTIQDEKYMSCKECGDTYCDSCLDNDLHTTDCSKCGDWYCEECLNEHEEGCDE